jgi:protein-disulfide isomerase
MHDRMFANQSALAVPALKQHAVALGLDAAKFDQCLDSGKHAASISEDMKVGESLGVGSTPTIYVNGRAVIGAQPYEVFKTVIDEELARIK